jgi:hypothetical protein
MTRRLTIRLANLWRENPRVEADLFKLLGDQHAHIVGINEGGDFTAEIRAAATACGYQVFGDQGSRAERMNPVLVRNDVRVFGHHVYKMCEQVGRPPHVSPARHATAVMFQLGSEKRAHLVTHMNSHVQSANGPRDLPRVGQYVAHMKRLAQLVREARQHGYRVTVSGDLNWSYSARVLGWYWSPRRTFKRLGMVTQWAGRGAPQRGSHGRRRIDYVAHDPRDLTITGQRLLDTHSDHRAPEIHYVQKESA